MGDWVYGCGGGREVVKNAFAFRGYSKYPTPIEKEERVLGMFEIFCVELYESMFLTSARQSNPC